MPKINSSVASSITPLRLKNSCLNTDELIEKLDLSFTEILSRNGTGSEKEKSQSSFYFKKGKPTIGIMDYLKRIRKFTDFSNEVLMIACVYVEHIMETGMLNLQKLNLHKLIFTSIIVAFKYQEDDIYSNGYYSKVGGIKSDELFEGELELLEIMEYRMFVDQNRIESWGERFHKNANNSCLKLQS